MKRLPSRGTVGTIRPPAPAKDAAAPRRATDSDEINALLEVNQQASDKLDVTAAALLWLSRTGGR